jgi:hypothetical protein
MDAGESSYADEGMAESDDDGFSWPSFNDNRRRRRAAVEAWWYHSPSEPEDKAHAAWKKAQLQYNSQDW